MSELSQCKLYHMKTLPHENPVECPPQGTLQDRGSLLFLLGEKKEQGTSVSQGTYRVTKVKGGANQVVKKAAGLVQKFPSTGSSLS